MKTSRAFLSRCALLGLLSACSSRAPQREPKADAGQGRAESARAPVNSALASVRAATRLPRLLSSELTDASAGTIMGADQRLELRADEDSSLTLEDYGALRILGPARLVVLPEAEPALLIGRGVAAIDVSSRSQRATPSALWLGTPVARVEVPESARLALRVYDDGGVRLIVITGRVSVALPDARELSLGAGDARCLTGAGVRESSERFVKLEAAERWLSEAAPCLASPPVIKKTLRARGAPPGNDAGGVADGQLSTPLDPTLALEEQLASVLTAITRDSERERALVSMHQTLHTSDAAAASSLRAEVVQAAASLMRLRVRARALRAQLESASLREPPSAERALLLRRARQAAPYR
jgi:hypothetical protein